MKILVFEDSGYKNIFPINMLRATYDIKCGVSSILRRVESIVKNKFEITLHCRKILFPYIKEYHINKINIIGNDDYLLLNGRVIFNEHSLKNIISKKEKNSYYMLNDTVIAAYITKEKINNIKNEINKNDDEGFFGNTFFSNTGLKKLNYKNDSILRVINYSWDLIDYILKGGLNDDLFVYLNENKKFSIVKAKENFINHKNIFISKNVNIMPEVVIDATEGMVFIEENSKIEPFTYIKGPVYIGRNCLIKSGTKIYGPCVIGEYSKVAGEIAESILHSYVNKQHDGFVGHSYICPFVNLGADTVTSDLKNNYSKVKMDIDGNDVDTGLQFLGSIIGDHSKTSINTMLNTGSRIGIFANIFGNGFPEKDIKSFSWIESGKKTEKYDIDKALETAKIVMERRGVKMSKEYKEVVRSYY